MNNGIVLMALATLCFSLLSVCVKYVPHIPAHELILFRGLITLMISYAHVKKLNLSPWGNNKKLLFARGFWGTVALTCFFTAVQKIPLATAATLQYSAPIFTAIFGIFYLKEKVRPIQWFLITLAIIGVVMINGIERNISPLYFTLAVFSGVFSGLAYVIVRKLKSTDHPAVIVFYFPFIAVPIMSIWTYFDFVLPKGKDWIFIILIGLLTQLGQLLMTQALQKENAARATSVMFIGTINAFLFSTFLFKEQYSIYSILGILTVSFAVISNIYFTSDARTKT
ncbi:MAG TPA: DMT family transporter [Chitinophagales bacterium]|nr:DMT family transporter [Chitinophagales bacterium]